MKKIEIMGCGYIGLPTAITFTLAGYEVCGFDVKPSVVESLNHGKIHIVEPNLQQAMDEAMATLRGKARIKRTMWSRRAQEYEQKINSGDPIAIAEVVRDLHRNAGQPDQSFSERQIYELALDRLAMEVAARDSTDKIKATAKLMEHLNKADKSADKGE